MSTPRGAFTITPSPRAWAAWAVTLGVAAYLRLSGAFAAVVGNEIAANGPDSAYHARRMLQTWTHYPHVPRFDPLLDWPHGATAPWPPGFDFLVATLAQVAHTRFGALLMISLAPVLLGLLLVVLTGACVRKLAPSTPWWTAWLAASLVALFPQAVSVSRFANPDHHCAEAVMLPALGLWALAAYRASFAPALSLHARLRLELIGAVLVGGSVAVFVGAPMYVCLISASLMIANLLRGHGASVRWAMGAPALVLGAGLAMLVYAPLVPAHAHPLSYVYPSWLQPLLVLAAAIGCGAATLLGWVVAGDRRRRSVGTAVAALLLLVVAGAGAATPAARELLHGLHEWFADSHSLLSELSENQPLFSSEPGSTHLSRAYLYYGSFGPLLLLLVPAGLARYTRKQGLLPALPFLIWTVGIIGLMLLQNRFGRVGLLNLAVCTAFVLEALAERMPRAIPVVCAVPALALALDPAFHFYLAPELAAPLPGAQEAGLFLRAHTPPPRVGQRSGVLVPWDEAHFIVRYGERPVTATGFGPYIDLAAVDEVQRIWSDDEAHLLRFARARDLGFVATSASLFTMLTLHGRGPMLDSSGDATRWNQDYFARVPLAVLLLGGSGVSAAGIAHLQHLLPRFASTAPPSGLPATVPETWVYELVPGATLQGRAPPDTLVRLQTAIHVRGHAAVHEAWTRAAADGSFTLTTPLPTGYRGEHFESAAQASLRIGTNPTQHLLITERSVRLGETQWVTPQAPR